MDSNWISPFWQAFSMPPRLRVCGFELPPLSVWHVFALEQIGNTYLTGGPVDAAEAQQLLLVASRSRAEFLRIFHDPRKLRRANAGIRRRMLRNAWRGGVDAVESCRAYVDQSMRIPGRWIKEGGKPCAVPHPLHVLAGAARFGRQDVDAWDMPYAPARCMFDTMAEQRGDDSIQSAIGQQKDEEMVAEMEAANG
jgi:hypothetical protein